MTPKIATCCYCGSRTALTLTARHGHELACGRCGAPLHEMKALKQDKAKPRSVPHRQARTDAVRNRWADGPSAARPCKKKSKKNKRRKPLWARALSEAFDAVEDIFD